MLFNQVTGDLPAVFLLLQGRPLGPTDRFDQGAAIAEGATCRNPRQARHHAGDLVQPSAPRSLLGKGSEQALRIGGGWGG